MKLPQFTDEEYKEFCKVRGITGDKVYQIRYVLEFKEFCDACKKDNLACSN